MVSYGRKVGLRSLEKDLITICKVCQRCEPSRVLEVIARIDIISQIRFPTPQG